MNLDRKAYAVEEILGGKVTKWAKWVRVVPVCMQDEVVPQFHRWCAIAASHVYNAVDEGISKGFLHPCVSYTYWPRLHTVTQN